VLSREGTPPESLPLRDDDLTAAQAPTPRSEAGPRQLTVMLCDLVGSPKLSMRLDTEYLRNLIGADQSACALVGPHFHGLVPRCMDEGMLIYSGYPHAHDNDAERAIRARLGVVDAMAP
jgi:class 3 adenylate cyclase